MLDTLAIDYDQRLVTVAGRAVELTPTEHELLRALSLDAGRVASYETLLTRVWGKRASNDWKVVRAFVKQLRASSATTRPTLPGSSMCAASATACPGLASRGRLDRRHLPVHRPNPSGRLSASRGQASTQFPPNQVPYS